MNKFIYSIFSLSAILSVSSPALATCENYPFQGRAQVKTTIDGGTQASFTVRLPYPNDDPVFEAAAVTAGEVEAQQQLSNWIQVTLKKDCESNNKTSINFGAGTSEKTFEQVCSFIQLPEVQTLKGSLPLGSCSTPFSHILVTYGISSKSERNAKKIGSQPYPNSIQENKLTNINETVKEERGGRSTGYSSYTSDW